MDYGTNFKLCCHWMDGMVVFHTDTQTPLSTYVLHSSILFSMFFCKTDHVFQLFTFITRYMYERWSSVRSCNNITLECEQYLWVQLISCHISCVAMFDSHQLRYDNIRVRNNTKDKRSGRILRGISVQNVQKTELELKPIHPLSSNHRLRLGGRWNLSQQPLGERRE